MGRNLKPGEKLFDEIHGAIWQCKVGVAVFSPRYCESYFCLHELAMIMESKKKVWLWILLKFLFFLLIHIIARPHFLKSFKCLYQIYENIDL